MRPIKFRARNANLPSCWVHGYFFIEDGCCFIINKDGKFKVISETESQFTGLLDKNGKEIYEGDILKVKNIRADHNEKTHRFIYKYRNVKVVWYSDSWKGELSNGEKWDNQYTYEDWSDDIDWEKTKVIGNIFENPELWETK